jgi:hypothetical protein
MASDTLMTCPVCGCTHADPAHAIAQALQADDLDAALQLGLLDAAPCAGCDAACTARLVEVRDARRFALAARERHRARDAAPAAAQGRTRGRASPQGSQRRGPGARVAVGRRGCAGACAGEGAGTDTAMTATTQRAARGSKLRPAEIVDLFARLRELDPAPTTELDYSTPFELLVAVVLSAQATDVGVNKATRKLYPGRQYAGGDPGARRGRAEGLHQHHRPVQREGRERHRAPAACCWNATAARSRARATRSRRCRAWAARPPTWCSTPRSAKPTIAVDTHIFRVVQPHRPGTRQGCAHGRGQAGPAGPRRIQARRPPLADPARALHLQGAQAGLRALRDPRPVPLAGENRASAAAMPHGGDMSIKRQACHNNERFTP